MMSQCFVGNRMQLHDVITEDKTSTKSEKEDKIKTNEWTCWCDNKRILCDTAKNIHETL